MEQIILEDETKKIGKSRIFTWSEPKIDSLEKRIFDASLKQTGLSDKSITLQLPCKNYPLELGVPSNYDGMLASSSGYAGGPKKIYISLSKNGIIDHPYYFSDDRIHLFKSMNYSQLFAFILIHELGHIYHGDLDWKVPKFFRNIYASLVLEPRADKFAYKHLASVLDEAGL